MLLTRKQLDGILEGLRISISKSLEDELLATYGRFEEDDEGHLYEYTEQDLYEQIRKRGSQ